MPLPAALLARLAKRGIVENQEVPPPSTDLKSTGEEEEEIFAEDYDDPTKSEPEVTKPETVQPVPGMAPPNAQPRIYPQVEEEEEPLFFETTKCPNRINPYHECLKYCKDRYGMKEWNPQSDMIRKRNRMISKYPLPAGWVEVGDFDTNRYYYWNTSTDEVSWLSPTHPRAQILSSAESLGIIGKVGDLDSAGEEIAAEAQDDGDDEDEDDVNSESGSGTSLSDEEEFEETPPKSRGRYTGRQSEGRKGRAKEELDPMDPASYSDIPRGGWNDGLDTRGKAKTGVDVTASGPLFQQRPYPSPGDILRANQGMKKK